MKEPMTAVDVMNPVVFTVRDDMTIRELANFFLEKGISGAPVADETGKLIGVVSVTDIAESASESGSIVPDRPEPDLHLPGWDHKLSADELRQMHVEDAKLLVRDIMTPTVYTIPEDTPISQIARTMVSGRVHRLLVTRENKVVGIVTTLDMLKLLL
jgi:predicted transcriptional regulator